MIPGGVRARMCPARQPGLLLGCSKTVSRKIIKGLFMCRGHNSFPFTARKYCLGCKCSPPLFASFLPWASVCSQLGGCRRAKGWSGRRTAGLGHREGFRGGVLGRGFLLAQLRVSPAQPGAGWPQRGYPVLGALQGLDASIDICN